MMAFVAKSHSEKQEDKINIIVDQLVTNLFLSIFLILKFRCLISPRNLTNTPHKDIKLANQNCISLKERVVMAKRAKFLSAIQGVGKSDCDFLARLREKARYCDIAKFKLAGNSEEELLKKNLISGLRDTEGEDYYAVLKSKQQNCLMK